ncbi:MAG: heme exporter protein CcmB [Dongiaceae bacterium]
MMSLLSLELRQNLRQTGEWLQLLGFLLLSLFLLSWFLPVDVLAAHGIAFIYVIAILASLLSMDRLFTSDWEDGSLDLMLLDERGFACRIAIRVFAFWLALAGSLAIALAPALMVMQQPLSWFWPLLGVMGLAALAIVFWGALLSSLTLGLKGAHYLLFILLLPLLLPILIFSLGILEALGQGLPVTGPLLLTAAFCLASVTLSPFLTAGVLRFTLQ